MIINVNGCSSSDINHIQDELIKYKNVTYDDYEDDYVDMEEVSGQENHIEKTLTEDFLKKKIVFLTLSPWLEVTVLARQVGDHSHRLK